MSTNTKRQQKVGDVQKQLSSLGSLVAQDLARVSDLSPTINFKEAVPHLEEMLDVAKQLSQRDLLRLPIKQLDQIDTACNALESLISKVREFDLNQDKPGDVALVSSSKSQTPTIAS